MTMMISPLPIRPQPGFLTSYGNSIPHSQSPAHYSIHPEGNYLRQRMTRKIGRPGSNIHVTPLSPPPSSAKSQLRRAYMLPKHHHHHNNQAAPFTPVQETDKRLRSSPVSVIEYDSSIDHATQQQQRQQPEERTYKVSFAPQVAVYEIPHRNSYTDKSLLWNSQKEIRRQAARNTVEYTYERFDWRNAVEEKYFVRLPNGQLLHPSHVSKQQYYYLREQYRLRQREHKCKQQLLFQKTVHDLSVVEDC